MFNSSPCFGCTAATFCPPSSLSVVSVVAEEAEFAAEVKDKKVESQN